MVGQTPTSDQLDQRDNVSIDPLIDGLAFPEPGKPWYALVAGRVKEHGPQDTVLFEGPPNTGNLGKKVFGQLSYCQIWPAVAGTHVNKYEAYASCSCGKLDLA
jgi:hypothetical protein